MGSLDSLEGKEGRGGGGLGGFEENILIYFIHEKWLGFFR
jgi:hypothetical protein